MAQISSTCIEPPTLPNPYQCRCERGSIPGPLSESPVLIPVDNARIGASSFRITQQSQLVPARSAIHTSIDTHIQIFTISLLHTHTHFLHTFSCNLPYTHSHSLPLIHILLHICPLSFTCMQFPHTHIHTHFLSSLHNTVYLQQAPSF